MLKRAILIVTLVTAGAIPSFAQTSITFGSPPIAEVEAVFVAKELGIFDKNGLKFEALPSTSNQAMVAALVSGSHQIAAISPTVLLQAIDSGMDLVVVGTCGVTSARTAKNIGLAVRSGVEISKPEDLEGKKIGAPGTNGTIDVLFKQWLKLKNIPETKVTFIEVPIPNTADVLKGGTIDAIIAGQPSLARAVSQSNGKVAFHYMSELPENLPYTTFVTTRDWAKANADAVKAFQTSLAEGAAFVKANPDKTREILSNYTKLPVEVLSTFELPECKTVPIKEGLDFFDKAMRDEGLLTSDIDTAGLIVH